MYQIFKRCFDCVAALLLFVVISPLFAILALLVRAQIGSPIFFRQMRTTKDGRQFGIVKFRSMTNACDEDGNLLPDEKRLTRLGRILRATSLDELPELLNIIKGDMAVVGPRPMPAKYDAYYTPEEKKRFLVRGGLIPPEVLYRNVQPTWDEQLKYEADYGENVSLKLDAKIVFAVFRGLFTRYQNDYGEYVRMDLDQERTLGKETVTV